MNRIILGDFKDIQQELKDESIDLVFTDPPYLKKYLHTYDYLAEYCPRLMKRGASLVTILGHFALEEVMVKFIDKLKYRWLLNLNQWDGPHARMAMGIEVTFKPMLWYVKDAYPIGRGFLRDGFKVEPKGDHITKTHHEWEQSIEMAKYYIKKLTKPGDTVLDPYCGSGAFLIAAREVGCNYIGIEKDINTYNIACERLNGL